MKISVDDACQSDVRVAELCGKYGIECIFYWPVERYSLAYDNSYTPLTADDCVSITREFEIGSHSITHRHLTKIPLEEAKDEIFFSKLYLERMFNTKITKFCPPRGYTTPELTEFTLDFYGSQRLTKGKNLVHVHPDSGANGNKHWLDVLTEDTEELWMHSWELDRYPQEWINLENVLATYS